MKTNMKAALCTFIFIIAAIMMIAGCGKSSKDEGSSINSTSDSGTVWYKDADGDGFGDKSISITSDTQPKGYVDNNLDCNDANAAINPMAVEIADGIDNNCNGLIDELPKAGIIPDTNQTKSYTDTFGEDSDFIIDAPSYTKLDEKGQALPDSATSWSMVKDNVTGLIWEIKNASDGVVNPDNPHDADNLYSWDDANKTFIDSLNTSNFGNFNDSNTWRLPTLKELNLITDNSVHDPSLNTVYFPGEATGIWSSTASVNPTTSAYYFVYNIGMAITGAKTDKHKAWAVRGKAIESDFENLDKNIVIDHATGLMWQKATATGDRGTGYTFEQALTYCQNLTLSGYTDWRLPNKNELMTLAQYDKQKPAIQSDIFSDTQSALYWTSTTQSNNANIAWCINFSDGALDFTHLKTANGYARAVRGGNATNLTTWYRDKDGDGFGDRAVSIKMISTYPQPSGYVADKSDCDDSNASINPMAQEVANDGIDQNCNGLDLVTWYKDSDGDGYGDQTKTTLSETKPAGYVRNTDDIKNGRFDCNDLSAVINPDMVDLVDNGLDDNCNGHSNVSWYRDRDGDGYGAGPRVAIGENPPSDGLLYSTNDLDCNDNDAGIHPGLVETYGDAVDTNCNGEINDDSLKIVPDTGQTTTYTTYGGEDGNFLVNPPSYTKISSQGLDLPVSETNWAAIRDNVTGLYWEIKSNSNTYTYSEALTYVSGLNTCGFTDWRLPSATELAMIANLDQANPAINKNFFPNVQAARYWTDTDYSDVNHVLSISFTYGQSYPAQKPDRLYVIAVRSSPSVSPLKINGDGTVTDKESGLIWYGRLSTSGTWNDSVSYWASATSPSGYSDWRLPTVEEADSLLSAILSSPSIKLSDYFNIANIGKTLWTYTLSDQSKNNALTFNLSTGISAIQQTSIIFPSIGVRGTQIERFIKNNDGTVFDTKTGLMWLADDGNFGLKMSFTDALNYCNNLIFAGYSDWRLPNRNELLSLLDAAVNTWDFYIKAFPNSGDLYWTSSSSYSIGGNAWQINFETNNWDISLADYGTQSNSVRAVRGGKNVL